MVCDVAATDGGSADTWEDTADDNGRAIGCEEVDTDWASGSVYLYVVLVPGPSFLSLSPFSPWGVLSFSVPLTALRIR
jgi:hypothetical protein